MERQKPLFRVNVCNKNELFYWVLYVSNVAIFSVLSRISPDPEHQKAQERKKLSLVARRHGKEERN